MDGEKYATEAVQANGIIFKGRRVLVNYCRKLESHLFSTSPVVLCIRCCGRNPFHNLIFLDRYIKKKERRRERKRGQLSPLVPLAKVLARLSIRSILLVSFCRIDKRINNPIIIKYYPFDQLIPFIRANPPRSTCLHRDSVYFIRRARLPSIPCSIIIVSFYLSHQACLVLLVQS